MPPPTLALFDLDHTLLTGDTDVLWCGFLIAEGLLDAVHFGTRNADLEARYRSGTVTVEEFAGFYVSTLAHQSLRFWAPLRERFLREHVLPNICSDARALVQAHHAAGDLVVMTTATNRFLTELTALSLNIDHLLATECETEGNGNTARFTGRTTGVLNMRDGKVTRLHMWLNARGQSLADFDSVAYSDSINDLPLLQAVNRAVAIDPDPRLLDEATRCGWQVLHLNR